jgi:hypothetical protein
MFSLVQQAMLTKIITTTAMKGISYLQSKLQKSKLKIIFQLFFVSSNHRRQYHRLLPVLFLLLLVQEEEPWSITHKNGISNVELIKFKISTLSIFLKKIYQTYLELSRFIFLNLILRNTQIYTWQLLWKIKLSLFSLIL